MPLTAVPNIDAPESLVFKGQQGEEVVLTSSKLERWLAASENMMLVRKPNPLGEGPEESESDSLLAVQFISRFGFKNPGDLIAFLKSDGGKTTLSLIQEQLAIIAKIEEDSIFRFREEEAMRQRMISHLMLLMIYRKEEKDNTLRDLMQAEIDRMLHQQVASAQGILSTPQMDMDASEKLIAHYDSAARSLRSELDELNVLAQALETEMVGLKEEGKAIDGKYKAIGKHINRTSVMIEKNPSPEEIEQQIAALRNAIDRQSHQIEALSNNENFEEARQILQESIGLNTEIAMLKDLSDVNSDKSVLFALSGQKTFSFEATEFIIPKDKAEYFESEMEDKQFVKEGGQYYLITKQQRLEDLNQEQKISSHEAGEKLFKYLGLRPEAMMSVQKLVHHNESLEQSENNNKISKLSDGSQKIKEKIDVITKTLTEVLAAREREHNILQALKQSQAQIPNPTPTTTMSPMPDMPTFTGPRPSSLPTAAKNIEFLTEINIHTLKLMQKNGMTAQALTDMRNELTHFPNVKGPNNESTLEILNRTRPGDPIPQNDLNDMLEGLKNLKQHIMGQKTPKKEQEDDNVSNPTHQPSRR